MIKSIEIINKPRQVGKTTRLLELHTNYTLCNYQTIYVCYSYNEAQRLIQKSVLDTSILHRNPIVPYSRFEYTLRGRFNINQPIYLILDEPFIYDLVVQQDMLERLEYLPYNFYIYGEGTLRENFRKDFTHYLVEY